MIARGISVLGDEERSQIHDAALEVLERTGMAVEEERLRGDLRSRGAGGEGETVLFPRELVDECLGTVDRRPKFHCVNGKALECGPGRRFYASLVTDPFIVDYQSGPRPPCLEDISAHARLNDALPLVDEIHLMDDTIPGLDPGESTLRGLEAFVGNTTTAYHCAPGSLEATRHWIEISQIMSGQGLERNPILATYVPSVSPLVITAFNTGQLRMFLDNHVLCNVGPCAIAGATAPYTTAGLVVQSWAEFLGMVVAGQTIMPGSPVMGGGGGGHSMDMRTGESMYSGMSKALASAAINELCAARDLPVSTGNFTTLCSTYGVQNGMESALGVFGTFFARADRFGSLGSLANARGMSPTQIVLHHDLLEVLQRFARGIDVSGDRLGVESIARVGPHGGFLEDDLTVRYLRSGEHFTAPCYEQCAGAEDQSTMEQRAWERARELMHSHVPDVPADRVEEVRRYVEKQLG